MSERSCYSRRLMNEELGANAHLRVSHRRMRHSDLHAAVPRSETQLTMVGRTGPSRVRTSSQLPYTRRTKERVRRNTELQESDKLLSRPWVPSCLICMDENNENNWSALTCGHIYCSICISEWVKRRPSCPVCNKTISPNSIIKLCPI